MKQIIVIILFYIFISYSRSAQIPEYTCMNNIVSTTGIDKTLFLQDGSEYNFCVSNNIACDSSGYITTLSLKSTNKLDFSKVVISCLSRLNNLTLDSFGAFDSALMVQIDNQNIKILSLLQPDVISIDQQLNNIQEINIKTNVNIPSIKLSSFLNLKKFTHIQVTEGSPNGLVTFENDLKTQINLNTFSFTAREIPDLSLVAVDQLQINYLFGTNDTSKVQNFITFSLVKNLVLRNIIGNTNIPFPDQLLLIPNGGLLTSFSSDNGYSSINGKFGLSSLSSLEYFSIRSSGSLSTFRSSQAGDGFPFNSFPSTLTYFELSNQLNAQAKIGGDIFFKSNLKTLVLKKDNLILPSSSFPNGWPTSTITKLDVSNNPDLMKSVTLDSSFCSLNLLCSGSGLPAGSVLPSCYTCHFGDNNYKLTSFSDITNTPVCTTLIPKARETKRDGKITIFGKDLGFDGRWITSTIQSNPNWIIDINSQQLYAESDYEGLFNITYSSTMGGPQTFTLTNLQKPPMPSAISSTTASITIKGTYFSYDITEIQVFLGSSLQFCVVQSATFYEIVCTYQYSSSVTVEQSSYIQVRDLKSSLFTINLLQDNAYTSCDEGCPSERCNINSGTCSCDPVCNNGGYCTSSGQCNCPSNWGGIDCSTPIQYISAVEETTIDGGYVYIYGWFGQSHEGATVFIGDQECDITNINETNVDCFIGPGQGEVKLNMTQNGISTLTNYRFINPIKSCPNQCSGVGICNNKTSECSCPTGFSGFDCGVKDNNGTSIDHGESGSTSLLNEYSNFTISVVSLIEVTVDGQEVTVYPLATNWGNRSYSNNIYSYYQPLSQGSNISLIIEEVKQDKQFNFAGDVLLVKANSLKISLSIKNYSFKSSLNTLKLLFSSTVVSQTDDCNKQDFSVQNINNIETSNYITIQKDKKILYGSFYKKIVSDGRPTFSPSNVIKNNINSSVIVELSLPHCVSECLIDPDFSLLVSNDFESCESGRAKWVLPVAIVVPVVGLAAIIIVSSIIYKKNKVAIRVMKVKLRELNKSGDH